MLQFRVCQKSFFSQPLFGSLARCVYMTPTFYVTDADACGCFFSFIIHNRGPPMRFGSFFLISSVFFLSLFSGCFSLIRTAPQPPYLGRPSQTLIILTFAVFRCFPLFTGLERTATPDAEAVFSTGQGWLLDFDKHFRPCSWTSRGRSRILSIHVYIVYTTTTWILQP